MIPYSKHEIDQGDIDVVVEVLRNEWLTQGRRVGSFEQAVAAYCGVANGVAVSSGSAALHLACRVLDFGPGDTLWTSPITFVASANCALHCGGDVDFVDIDPQTYNLSVDALADKLQRAGRLPKIVVPVHFAGQSCDMAGIRRLADAYGFHVVEDASHALGARYRQRPVGSCEYSDITVLSFHPVKSITCGEGGMLLTPNARLAERAARLRSHGIDRRTGAARDIAEGGWYHEQTELGFNYRLTDLQAALGASQLRRLDGFVAARHRLATRYDAALARLPLTLPRQADAGYSARHLYPVVFTGGSSVRRAAYDALHAANIRVQVHYIPVHLQPLYRDLGFAPGDYPEAEAFYGSALSLPLFPRLGHAEQDQVISVLRRVLDDPDQTGERI